MKQNIKNLSISDEEIANELLIELSKQFQSDDKFQQKGDVTTTGFMKKNNIHYDLARSWLDAEVIAGRLEKFEVRLWSKVRGFVYRRPGTP